MKHDGALLLSIRPEHAEHIFDGSKSVELRRVRPRLKSGSIVLVYVTAPVMSLAGAFSVSETFAASPDSLWRKVGPKTGISRASFREYFEGRAVAYGIGVQESWRLSRPLGLGEIRQRLPKFLPPQSYWYLPEDIVNLLTSRSQLGQEWQHPTLALS